MTEFTLHVFTMLVLTFVYSSPPLLFLKSKSVTEMSSQPGVQYVLTVKLTQDSLEYFFLKVENARWIK